MSCEHAPARMTCQARMQSLPALMQFVGAACIALQASPAEQHDLLLITEEACANVIHHAYPPGAGGDLTLQLGAASAADGQLFTLTVIDQGTPFDPFAPPLPDTNASINERAIGGLGILLIRELADTVAYRYDVALGNVLTIQKRLGMRPTPP